MADVNINSEEINEEEKTENVEETIDENTETSEENTEKKTEKNQFNYKAYGKEAAGEARENAKKLVDDFYSAFKSMQGDWNKTIDEYRTNKPAADLLEYEDKLVIKMDLPRVSKEDVSVKMSTEAVYVEVEFPEESEEEDVKVLRKERCSGKTKSVIPLPVEIEVDDVKASFEDNELTITLPKEKIREVDVEIV
ncbi:Hsp20/alpha crystallin family protein [Methanosphaera sp.]